MSPASLFRLLLLSAIWGGSFLLIRIGAPALGPGDADGSARAAGGAVPRRGGPCAAPAAALASALAPLPDHRPAQFGIALFALRLCGADAAGVAAVHPQRHLAAVGHADRRALATRAAGRRRLAGLVLGIVGVGLLVGFDRVALAPGAGLAIVASLAAALCYAVASSYAKSAREVAPFANAHGSMWAASLLIAPVLLAFPPVAAPTPGMLALLAALGVLCSGIAYLLYFRLIEDIGAAPALTVTFLIPLFGSFFGWLILDEAIGWHTLAGGTVVIAGTALVTGFSPRLLAPRREAANA
jgi:uncharacterized membrane protein